MFPHFFVSFFSRFQSFCESKEREKRRKGRRESSFFLVSGLPLPSPPLFHKKYKKFCQHKTSSVCALKSRTWHTIRRNARRLFSFPRHSSFVLYVFVLMFLCARICCSFLLLFFYSSRLFSSSKQKGSKKPKNLFVSFFWKERKKERVEREKERRKKRRERERERRTDTNFFFLFSSFKASLSLSLILSLGPTLDDEPRVIPHQRIQNFVEALTMHTRALARNIIAVGGRERFQRLVETMRNPKPLWQHWGFNFQIFWFRVRKKGGTGNAIKRAQRFKNCLGGSSLHTNGKRNGRRNE